MKQSQNLAYVLLAYNSRGETEIFAIGESVRALIELLIESNYIDNETMVDPTGDGYQILGEYLQDWKENLPLLSQNEFNDWFAYDFRIDLYPMTQEKNKKVSKTP